MVIKNNPSALTDQEKQALKTAKYFAFTYGVGLIFITGQNNEPISWNCSNSVAAKEYLESNGIRELV
jgi:hypothetical protein